MGGRKFIESCHKSSIDCIGLGSKVLFTAEVLSALRVYGFLGYYNEIFAFINTAFRNSIKSLMSFFAV